MTQQSNSVRVVMVSSTARDLPQHREHVMAACLTQNLFPKMMEYLPASDANAIKASLQMVDEADLYVGVIAFRYGYVPKGHKISVTEMEYDRAGKRGIPRLMFLMDENHPLRVADVETGLGADKLRAFRERIGLDRVIGKFISPEDLRARVVQALSEFRAVPIREELVTSQISRLAYRVAVINQCDSVAAADIERGVEALQVQVHRDLAPTWGIDAELTLVRSGETPPEKSWWLHLQDDIKEEGVLGYHGVNAAGLPLAYVGVRSSRKAGMPWTLAASHTLLQLLADPKGKLAVVQGDRVIPQEICRQCYGERYAYKINGVLVSDFVLPAWFDNFRKQRSAPFDYCGHISEPFQVLPGAYLFYFQNATQSTLSASHKAVRAVRKPRVRSKKAK
jgi:hypothetical protein